MKINKACLLSFIILFAIEALIAIFVHDSFIRPYVGDILVVVLLYLFVKIFVHKKITWLPLYIFIFAALVEFGQYFRLAELLGLADNKIARVIIGSTFDLKDIACYAIGCCGLLLYELFKNRS